MNNINTVFFLGSKGSYSHIAAQKYFRTNETMSGQISLEDVFDTVKQNYKSKGVIPFENSTTGSITKTYDLLLKKKLIIIGELYLRIHHKLWGIAKINLKDVEKCYSHPQAFEQCFNFFKKHSWIKKCAVSDTANAMKIIANKKNIKHLAIGADKAANINNLINIKHNIEDNKNNYTRFAVISNENVKNGNKITIVFSVNHVPGSLFTVLKPYAENNLNLTKIESRPIIGKPWEYLFYLDFELNNNRNIKKILNEMRRNLPFFILLGQYDKGKTYEI